MISSRHFSNKELACRHCGRNECTQGLVDSLEAFREIVGQPVLVHDAYRCPEHNAKVGGVPDSEHVRGLAADIAVQGLTAAALEGIARQVPTIHGIGRADQQGYIHVDVREAFAHWCYDASGKFIDYYPPKATEVAA